MSSSAAFELAKDLEYEAREAGFSASTDQIARWSRDGLLPRKLKQHGLGQGNGSEVRYPIGTGAQLLALCHFHVREGYRKLEAVGWYLWLNDFTVGDKYWRKPLHMAATVFTDGQQQIKKRLLNTAMGIVSVRQAGSQFFVDVSEARINNRQFRRARRRVGSHQIGEFCRLVTTIATGLYQAESQHNEADRLGERSLFEQGFGLAKAYTDRLQNGVTLLSEPFEPDLERFSSQLKKISKPSLLRRITSERMKQARDDLRLLFLGLTGTYLNLKTEHGENAFGLGVIADFGTITDIKLQALIILLFDATIRSDPSNRLREVLAEIEKKRVTHGQPPDDTGSARSGAPA
jgi:hypothetical protein